MADSTDWDIPAPSRQGSEVFGFLLCAFASLRLCSGHALREIFRFFWLQRKSRGASVVNAFSQKIRNNHEKRILP